MLSLTTEQRVKVEENMGLVGKVIGDCVHTLDKGCIYTYDDLFQIGCIGLCKAFQTDRSGHENAFSTYAYYLIRNEIYTQLEYATRRGREQCQRRCDFVVFRRTGNVEKWRVKVYSS